MKKNNKFGFTLIELLVVCIALAILATFAIVSYQKSVQDSRNDKAKSTLKKVANAYSMFDYEYPGRCINPGIVAKSSGTCSIAEDNAVATLINCKYMDNEDWDDDPYRYEVCGTDCNVTTALTGFTCCDTDRYACSNVKSDRTNQEKGGSRYTDDDYAIILNKDGTLEEGAYLESIAGE